MRRRKRSSQIPVRDMFGFFSTEQTGKRCRDLASSTPSLDLLWSWRHGCSVTTNVQRDLSLLALDGAEQRTTYSSVSSDLFGSPLSSWSSYRASPPNPWNLEQEPRGEASRYQWHRATRYQRRSLLKRVPRALRGHKSSTSFRSPSQRSDWRRRFPIHLDQRTDTSGRLTIA